MTIPFSLSILALDIDGTLTADRFSIPYALKQTLQLWHDRGWKIIFITGRPFQWSHLTLKDLSFPYTLAVQNGAFLLEMPDRKILTSHLLSQELINPLKIIFESFKTSFAVYGGYQAKDWCYYVLSDFSLEIKSYILKRKKQLRERWQPLKSWDHLPLHDFASIKCFAKKALAVKISQAIENSLNLPAPCNSDPFDQDYFIVQATHPQATKGEVLTDFKKIYHLNEALVVAAGDDFNDYSLLKKADIKIVMATAPVELLKLATIVAPPAVEMGLLEGLKKAQMLLKGKKEWKKDL